MTKHVFWILLLISLAAFVCMAATLPRGRVPCFTDSAYYGFGLGRLVDWKEIQHPIEKLPFFLIMIGQPVFIVSMILLFNFLLKRNLDAWHLGGPNSEFWSRPENKEILHSALKMKRAATVRSGMKRRKPRHRAGGVENQGSNFTRRGIILRRIRNSLWELGSVCLIFFLFLVFDVIRTGRQENPSFGREIPAVIGLLLSAIVIWVVRFFRVFRLSGNRL